MADNFAGCSIYDTHTEEEYQQQEDGSFEHKWNNFILLVKGSPADFPIEDLEKDFEKYLLPLGPGRCPPTEVGWICNSDPTILVLADNITSVCGIDDNQLVFDFHKVDLKQGKLEEKFCPSVRTLSRWLSMFGGSSKIYVFGDQSCHRREEKYGNPPNWYKGASVLDTSTNTWKTIPRPQNHFTFWSCASLDNGNTLYHFGGFPFVCPEVYDQTSNSWEKLTPVFEESDKCYINGAVISDPINKRILFNISRRELFSWDQLYAYYPEEKKTQLVSVRVPWSTVVVVAKDVAFVCVHNSAQPESICDMLQAYDLSTWISKRLDVVWTSTMLEGMDVLNCCSCTALFYVGSDIFWMSFWRRTNKTDIYFLKFTATREEDKITCEPLSFQQHELSDSDNIIHDFVMIHQDW